MIKIHVQFGQLSVLQFFFVALELLLKMLYFSSEYFHLRENKMELC